MRVLLGNRRAKDGSRGERVTVVDNPDATADELFVDITHPSGVWAAHSDAPPTWVSSDDPALAEQLAEHFGVKIREENQ